jgi:hypothetical protein
VVPHLRGVVEHAAGRRLLHDGFEVEVLELGALDQIVQVGGVGLVVLAVMELKRFAGNVRCQCVERVGQRGQGVFHGVFSQSVRFKAKGTSLGLPNCQHKANSSKAQRDLQQDHFPSAQSGDASAEVSDGVSG